MKLGMINNETRNSGLDPLSGQDRLFLLTETQEAHMHVGAALVFESGKLGRSRRGVDFERIKQHIGARLRFIPRYRQRIGFTPLSSLPHWIDDEAFDLDRHVRHLSLPQPGNEQQLKELCSQILSRPLDRSRPLWEIAVVEGLSGGRFALVAKTHHCLVDGVGGVNLLAALLDPHPGGEREPVLPWKAQQAAATSELLRRELSHRVEQSIRFGRRLQDWASAPIESTVRLGEQVAGVAQFLGTGLRPAPDSPINRRIGSQRRFDWISFDLSEVKEVKRLLGGTINDVVLATVSGALHHFLSHHRRVRPVDLRALVPVNMRREGEAEAIGNHISAFLVRLPVGVVDPVRRLRAVKRRMEAIKASSQAAGGEILAGAGVPLLGTLMRFADRLNAFNVVITNVPGPPVPLYLAGAHLQEIFPQVPLFPNQGLGIALFSYAGKLHWGLNADRDVLPDLSEFKESLAASFEELCSAWPGLRAGSKAKVFRLIPRAKAV